MEKLGDIPSIESQIQLRKRKRKSSRGVTPKIQITECVREFKLHQAYPSLAKQIKTSSNLVNAATDKVMVSAAQPVINLKVNSGKIDPSNKIQKIKLKGPDGKDLGEFDVQVVSKVNSDINPTHGVMTTLDNNTKIKVTSAGVIKNSMQSVNYVSKNQEQSKGYQNPTHGILIPISPMVLNNNNQMEQQNIPIDDRSRNSNVFVVQSAGSKTIGSSKAINTSNIKNVKTVTIKNSTSLPSRMKIQVINGLCKPGMNINNLKRQRSSDQVPFIKQRFLETESVNSSLDNAQVISLDNLDDEQLRNAPYYILPDKDIPIVQSNEVNKTAQEIKCPGSVKTLLGRVNNNNMIKREKNDMTSMRTECDSTNNPVLITSSDERNDSSQSDNNTAPENHEDNLHILSEALKHLPDEALREKALRILKNIGIGTERKIPKKPVEQISVKDSNTQTVVFGLFGRNTEEFVKVSEEALGVERITPINRRAVDRREEHEKTFAKELNSMLTKLEDHETVKKVQDAMKFDPVTEKLYSFIKKDFEDVKKYDDDGYLNIHKAVLHDNIRAVKRQLMILKACKISVDIATKGGMTSLELVMQESDSVEMVKLLLNAGANPISLKIAHDSALTIAAKESLSILPLLIKYVSRCEDLNYVDSEGFAAIHYCALLGNYTGTKALVMANADVNVRDNRSGRTALFHALENENLEIVKELLNHGATTVIPNFSGQTVFHLIDDIKHTNVKDQLMKSMKPKTTSSSCL